MNFTDQFIKSLGNTKVEGINCINHIRALAILSRTEGGLLMSRLGEQINVSPAAMTMMIDTLDRMGLAERVPMPTDRRAFRIFITAKEIDTINRIVLP